MDVGHIEARSRPGSRVDPVNAYVARNGTIGWDFMKMKRPLSAWIVTLALSCGFRPCRSAIPGEADHPYRSKSITLERDAAG